MSYRKITVDGTEYKYSVGKSHVKIKGMEAVPREEIGYRIDDYLSKVRPRDVETFIRAQLAK
ncbi:hypothetical protein vBRpoSV10_119 [Ruegeria phage vB_RpoS-V10]|nr:hypothetical protein DSS3P8_118 [Roseobacter phage DSS3P8]AWY09241.1 hypothetical protein vBRpoSV10_119 [Ruegeria phage vB_RpoS-V10]